MPRPVDHSLCRKLPLVARAFVLASCLGLVSCGTTFPNFSAWDEDLPPIHEFPVKRAPVVIHRGSIGLDTDSRYEAGPGRHGAIRIFSGEPIIFAPGTAFTRNSRPF